MSDNRQVCHVRCTAFQSVTLLFSLSVDVRREPAIAAVCKQIPFRVTVKKRC